MCAYLATKPASIGGVPKRSPGAPARKRKLSAEGPPLSSARYHITRRRQHTGAYAYRGCSG